LRTTELGPLKVVNVAMCIFFMRKVWGRSGVSGLTAAFKTHLKCVEQEVRYAGEFFCMQSHMKGLYCDKCEA